MIYAGRLYTPPVVEPSAFAVPIRAVIDVSDPKHIGRVKANAPALFNPETMSKEGLPWIYPFTMNGYQGFSKLTVGSKIWIFLVRPIDEFWYIPMFELHFLHNQIHPH